MGHRSCRYDISIISERRPSIGTKGPFGAESTVCGWKRGVAESCKFRTRSESTRCVREEGGRGGVGDAAQTEREMCVLNLLAVASKKRYRNRKRCRLNSKERIGLVETVRATKQVRVDPLCRKQQVGGHTLQRRIGRGGRDVKDPLATLAREREREQWTLGWCLSEQCSAA